jgi:GTPase SAR1 family protein
VILLCYDVTCRPSFSVLASFLSSLDPPPRGALLAVVATKCDLAEQREVPRKEGEAFAGRAGALHFETSAKEGINVDDLFRGVGRMVKEADDREIGEKRSKEEEEKREGRRGRESVKGCGVMSCGEGDPACAIM